MKLPSVILRRFEWRLGLRARPLRPPSDVSLRVPRGMSRAQFEAALASLPPGVDAEELREFVEGDDAAAPHACPIFRERLRRLLWSLVAGRSTRPAHLGRPLN